MSAHDRAHYADTVCNDYFGFTPRARSSQSSHSDYPPTLPPPYDSLSRRRTSSHAPSNHSTLHPEESISRFGSSSSSSHIIHHQPARPQAGSSRRARASTIDPSTQTSRDWLRNPTTCARQNPQIYYAAATGVTILRNGQTVNTREVAPVVEQSNAFETRGGSRAHTSSGSTVPYFLPAQNRSREMETHGRYRIVYP
ncbi:hypothetical protein B0A48_10734 [Cryoendolithus antarcticus]|uniref:Uncharacterized protein n=1 Tax=Cryoendolithus antarcticus TaxID=1507870 RepID=A0A1V8SY90_9PEZI|nr:hypothetical protein B0A48_10734 [Cryoendolithus antarcticus]